MKNKLWRLWFDPCPECHIRHRTFTAVRRCLVSVHSLELTALILGKPKFRQYKTRFERMKKFATKFQRQEARKLWKNTSKRLSRG